LSKKRGLVADGWFGMHGTVLENDFKGVGQ